MMQGTKQMATPEKLDFDSSFWKDPKWKDAKVKFLNTPLSFPMMEFKHFPRNRTHHMSPGSRTYTETVFDEKTGMYEFHQGCEQLHTVEFWQEVSMLSDEDTTAQEMQRKMVNLTREQVHEGYVHYCDVWTWEDNSPKTGRLMEAFEAEHKHGPRVRLKEKMMDLHAYAHDVQEKLAKAMMVPAHILKPPA
jgi:hypothetical protein